MKFYSIRFNILIISLFFLLTNACVMAEEKQAEHSHEHEHEQNHEHSSGVEGLTLNDGKKWKTDGPLRLGMQNIHKAVMNAEKSFSDKTLTQKDGEVLASQINKELIYLVNNCELEAKADASLHVLIGEMMQGIGELSKVPDSAGGFPRIHKTLEQYPQFFDHPDWESK